MKDEEMAEELKDANEKVVHLACNQNKDLKYKLTKATEIIKDQKELLDRVLSGAETLSDFAQNTLRKAEQFIKEIEK